ncbi:MAG: DUF445 family protein [Firmicutes bacterium]|nr:DUF445 family protein [Bacillota bacterium]
MSIIKLLILATVAAMIGWFTNIIAIKLIFRPLYPIKIPILNFEIQGLIPKRKEEIAKSVGDVVEEELLNIRDIIERIIEDEDISKIKFILKRRINKIVDEKLPALIPSSIKNMISEYVDEIVDSEGDKILKQLIEETIDNATERVSIADIVEEKINSYDIDKLERIIITIAKKELKHIEILGGVLGFFIGIIQGIIVLNF